LEGLVKVLQMPWTDRGFSQFHRRGVEILHEMNVPDRSSAYRIPSATRALARDANAAQISKLYSQKTSTQWFVAFLASVSASFMTAPSGKERAILCSLV
jgi:hypothetical protein